MVELMRSKVRYEIHTLQLELPRLWKMPLVQFFIYTVISAIL